MNWAAGIVIPIYGAEPQDAYNGSGVSTYCAGPHFLSRMYHSVRAIHCCTKRVFDTSVEAQAS